MDRREAGRRQREKVNPFAASIALLAAFWAPAVIADCLDDAATYWRVPTPLARAIATHESGMRADAVGRNKDGSRDIGLMQINTAWLPTLRKYGVTERDLYDPCVNAYVGNWILSQNIDRLGFNWDAIGAYNAASSDKRAIYARKIYRQLMAIQEGGAQNIRAPRPFGGPSKQAAAQ
ncbi:lytic transglycosylase [Ralstonia pickettii]|uniref:lytic transglycosylase domain-containing protein n=1 Tax=Ralstonia pickettii TaxID=329 RepID=UPI000BCC2450|nr:lytic transglycosylase domain-containing protein [Ralstonia pickettii]MBT2180858.1 lytic transglycosylase domain-containing protein [Ralstonia pickettii]POH90115.1 lytic transglycosylase [Ralstonia pickettii]